MNKTTWQHAPHCYNDRLQLQIYFIMIILVDSLFYRKNDEMPFKDYLNSVDILRYEN